MNEKNRTKWNSLCFVIAIKTRHIASTKMKIRRALLPHVALKEHRKDGLIQSLNLLIMDPMPIFRLRNTLNIYA